MGDIIKFSKDMAEGSKDSEDLASIEIELTDEYKEKLFEASDFIKDLPLSHAENGKLVALLTNATNQAMKDAFLQGFELGIKVTKEV